LHIAGVTGQNGAYEALRKTVRLEGLAALMGNCKSVPSPLGFMKSKRVLLAHELSLFGGPLLSMELAFLLRSVGAEVGWITVRKLAATDEVLYSLEHKMLVREGKVFLGCSYWVFDPGGERNLQGGGRRNGENKQVERNDMHRQYGKHWWCVSFLVVYLSQQLSLVACCLGIEFLEIDTFDLHCFQSFTKTNFKIFTSLVPNK
jgi:hypothetical protein